jgi:predicted dehydrogenase
MAKTYRVGIIGATGRGDYGHAVDTAFGLVDRVEVVAVADRDPHGRLAAQQRNGVDRGYEDYRQMLAVEQLDIVAICSRWVDQHHAMLMAAAEAGCHVYMEKPFCRTLAECDAVVQQFDMRHLKLGIAHVAVHSPVLHTVARLLADGIIGSVLELRGRGKEDHRGGGEDLWVLGSHIFAVMQFLAGSPERCFATVSQGGEPIGRGDITSGPEGIGLLAGDAIEARYWFPGGVTGHFASRRSMGGRPSRFALQIFGSEGMLELETGYLSPAWWLRDAGWSPGRSGQRWQPISSAGIDQPEPREDGGYPGGHAAAIGDLIEAIEEHRETRLGARGATGVIEMIAAVFESQRLGGVVALPMTNRLDPLSLMLAPKV